MQLTSILKSSLMIGLALSMIGCSDDDDDDATINGPPNGGTSDSPVGRFVSVISAENFVLPSDTSEWDIFVGETTLVTIDADLNLIAESETVATLTYSEADDWYRGVSVENDGDAVITTTYTVSYNDSLGEWQTRVGMQVDSDGDDVIDDSASFLAMMKPRLDWSARAGAWQVVALSTDGDTGAVQPLIRQGTVGSEGQLDIGDSRPIAFYNDDGTPRAQAFVDEWSEVYQWSVSTDQQDLMVFNLTIKQAPSAITDPDPSGYTTGDSAIAHGVPLSRLSDFAVSDSSVTVSDQTTTDVDGDGNDDYFGGDMSGQTINLSISSDGTLTAYPGGEADVRSFGYLAGGLLVAPQLDAEGTYNDLSIITLEVDSSGALTGNGRFDGYDFPDDGSADDELSDTEFEQMQDAGVLIFGNGVSTDGLSYVGMESIVPSVAN